MLKSLRYSKRDKLFSMLFALTLHGAVLYGLWIYRDSPISDAGGAVTVNLIDLTAAQPLHQPVEKHRPRPQLHAPPQQAVEFSQPDPAVAASSTLTVGEATQPPATLSGDLAVTCTERTPPSYPAQSKRLNEHGRVVLRVYLGEDGRVSNIEIQTPSGFPRLDDAALNAVKSWRCKPVMQNGLHVPAVALQSFNFILEGQ